MATNRDKILRDAEKLVQKGKIEQAIREYEKLLQANPNDTTTINRVGDLYGRVGQVDRAIELYERIADHFTQDGFTTKAIAILKKINRLAPQRLDIFKRLADLYIQQGLVVEAKSQFQILADWYSRNGDIENAIDANRQLVHLDASNHMAHLRLADLLIQHGAAEEAVQVYDRLGRMLLERDKLDEAERLYRHALEQNPPSGAFLAPMCHALLEAGRSTAARELLNAAKERSPHHHDLQVIQVRTHLVFGDVTEAVELAKHILEGDPDNTEFRCLVGRALLSAGEAVAARDLLVPAADKLLDGGDYGAAQQLLQELLGAMPQDADVLTLGLRAYAPSGDAEMLFTLRAALADSHFRTGQKEQALRLYRELLRAEPENSLIRQRVAQLEGVAPAAVVSDVVADAAPSGVAEAVDGEPGVIEVDLGDLGVADASSSQAITRGALEEADPVGAEQPPFDPEERLAEAGVFAKYGLVDKAIHHLEDILSFFPEQVEAREKLVHLYVEQDEEGKAVDLAQPLLEHYREVGNQEAIQALMATVLQGTAAAEPAKGAAAPLEEEVLIVDVDDGRGVMQPVAGELAGGVDDEFVVVIDDELGLGADASEAVVAAAALPDDELVAADDREEIGVSFDDVDAVAIAATAATEPEFGAIDMSGVGDGMAGSEAAVPVPPVETPVHEELVEISDTISGPSISDLEQLDFFIEQELYEDAIRLLDRLESEFPNDPDVLERRLTLKSRGVLLEEVAPVSEMPEELFADEEEFIDLAKELEDELAEEEAMVDEATGRGRGEAELEEVFREFQKGVSEQLSEEDSDTHFNLGIAYKEMGLLPEAIREFQVASRDSHFFIECCSMIGVCYLEQGMADQAAEWYRRALEAPDLSDESRLALRYDLASSLESAGDADQAIGLFEEIYSVNSAYRDVPQRLNALSSARRAN